MADWHQAIADHTAILMETLPSSEAITKRDSLLTDLAYKISTSTSKSSEAMAQVVRELQTAGSKRFFSSNGFGSKSPTFIDKLKPVDDWHKTNNNNDPLFKEPSQINIVEIIHNYYEFLYEDKPSDKKSASTLLKQLRKRSLPDSSRASCEGDITLDEVLKVISKIQLNKSAGPDKLPGLLYKTFK